MHVYAHVPGLRSCSDVIDVRGEVAVRELGACPLLGSTHGRVSTASVSLDALGP